MRAWILSDLHIEQSHWDLPESLPDFDVLIAAGDIHDPLSKGVRWLAERSGGRPVIYIPGNHEWYAYRQRFTIQDETLRAQKLAAELGVHLLLDSAVTIDGVRFLGSTLWTDFEIFGNGRLGMRTAGKWMNDFRVIFPTDLREALSPEQTLRWHMDSRAWLEAALAEPFDGKTVVVTHHLPHPRSVHPRFADDPVTPAFCSDLSELVENSGAELWAHGHTHTSCDYMAGQTRVVCNPKGYGPQSRSGAIENEEFKPELVLEF